VFCSPPHLAGATQHRFLTTPDLYSDRLLAATAPRLDSAPLVSCAWRAAAGSFPQPAVVAAAPPVAPSRFRLHGEAARPPRDAHAASHRQHSSAYSSLVTVVSESAVGNMPD
jgi:hypothetical protein